MAGSRSNREGPGMNEEEMEQENITITLTDETGRSLLCYVEHSVELDGEEYVLLLPVDAPIQIFGWEANEEDEEEEMLVDIEDEEEIERVFPLARAVLAEQDLTLNRAALTLTASGQLPEPNEEEVLRVELGEDEANLQVEEFQQLATFFHEEQEYTICTSLDPLLFFARLNQEGEPELLSPEDYQRVRSQLESHLEDYMFDEME